MSGIAASVAMRRDYGLAPRPPSGAGLAVVGVGLPRTGTVSLAAALEKLLDGPCFHFSQLLDASKDEVDDINKILDGSLSDKELAKFFQGKGFRAGSDFFFAIIASQMLSAFPSAKVVLTRRDAEEWFNSFSATVRKTTKRQDQSLVFDLFMRLAKFKHISDTCMRPFKTNMDPMGKSVYSAVVEGKESAFDFAFKFEEHIKSLVPKERLLVFDVKEGWEPLCSFLDLPVPEEPFPRVNDQAKFKKMHLSYCSIL